MFMLNKKVSVIVPVYNAEQYLERCIRSIMQQSYKNIEIILVNDGSVDSSKSIIDRYSLTDQRIKKKHINNSGPSCARNVGIDLSSGDFIQFVDADDFIDYRMTEKLVDNMSIGTDLVICGYKPIGSKEVTPKVLPYSFLNDETLTRKQFSKNFGQLYIDYYINYPWNKLYRAEIIKDKQIRFNESLCWGEDLLFNLDYFLYCENISFLREAVYLYNKGNTSSITSNFNDKYFENQTAMYNQVIKYLECEKDFDSTNKKIIYDRISRVIINSLMNLIHSKSNNSNKDLLSGINKILNWERTSEVFLIYKGDNIKKQFIAYLIRKKHVRGIFLLLIIKRSLNIFSDN